MIYTVTFNPALDYTLTADSINIGETNRSRNEYFLTGGKGINVSAMLCRLGIESTALGFIGGFTGQEIKKRAEEAGCRCDFTEIDGLSRINVKIKSGEETEINASGPVITETDIARLMEKIGAAGEGDYLVLAGSIPPGVPDTIYGDIIRRVGRGVKVIVDASGSLLMNAVKHCPFLIKPNNHELGAIIGKKLGSDRREVLEHAHRLRSMGAENVLVSLAGNGAVLSAAGGVSLEKNAPSGKVINSVGAGDSMVAGFLCGWLESHDYDHAFRMGIAAGSASAFSRGFADKEKIMEIYNSIL
ncbi:MAG: 1-phosphofructokinase [Porcipelethomonas sp.]